MTGGLRRAIVMLGTGGVGKTTCSLALAHALVSRGRRVLLLTVDPARRLHGLMEKVRRDRTGLEVRQVNVATGFADLVRRRSPDEATARTILSSRFFPYLSDHLSALHDYVAGDIILEAVASDRYDHVVVDTPPFAHAVHFLEAPERLHERATRAAALFRHKPADGSTAPRNGPGDRAGGAGGGPGGEREAEGGPGDRAGGAGGGPGGEREAEGGPGAGEGSQRQLPAFIARGLSYFLGRGFLVELVEFVGSFSRLFDGIGQEALALQAVWRQDATFVAVVVPDVHSTQDLERFLDRAPEWVMPGMLVVNRFLFPPAPDPGARELGRALGPVLSANLSEGELATCREAVIKANRVTAALAAGHRQVLEALVRSRGDLARDAVLLPLLPSGATDAEALRVMEEKLCLHPLVAAAG
jgi:anion-transporting  ArsA/GET3 family ATPase